MDFPPARGRLIELARASEAELNLAEAALLIAGEEYPDLDAGHYLAFLDDLATSARPAITDSGDPAARVGALNAEVFERQRFRGNVEDYYDPRNSFLNDVIDRRKGIPITLSVVYLEVGWRLGLPLSGVGMPGHFLVKYDADPEPILIDPFSEGQLLTAADCQQRLNQLYGGGVPLRPSYFEAVSKRQILIRMLTNLKGIYLQLNDFDRALAAVDRVLLLNPDDFLQYRDRGVIQFQRREYSAAVGDLQSYLQVRPEPSDAAAVRRTLEEIWRWQARLN